MWEAWLRFGKFGTDGHRKVSTLRWGFQGVLKSKPPFGAIYWKVKQSDFGKFHKQ